MACTSIDSRDGLGDNGVLSICENPDGSFWFATRFAGVTHYRPSPAKPVMELESVSLSGNPVDDVTNLPPVPAGQNLSIRYHATDLLTMPAKRNYRIRLTHSHGRDTPRTLLNEFTTETRRDLAPRSPGRYELLIDTVDRNLNYSEPIRLAFSVYLPWHMNKAIVVPGSAGILLLLMWLLLLYRRYLHQQRLARQLQEQMLEQEQQIRINLEQKNRELERLNTELKQHEQELKEALANIKTLRGLLPICSYCKRIRDDKGFWQRVESYIDQHSEAKFSHGICPECLKKHFPEIAEELSDPGSTEQTWPGNLTGLNVFVPLGCWPVRFERDLLQ